MSNMVRLALRNPFALEVILVPFLLSAGERWRLSLLQLAVEDHGRRLLSILTTCLVHRCCTVSRNASTYAGNFTFLQDFCIWDLELPLDVSYLWEASYETGRAFWYGDSIASRTQPNSRTDTDRTADLYTATFVSSRMPLSFQSLLVVLVLLFSSWSCKQRSCSFYFDLGLKNLVLFTSLCKDFEGNNWQVTVMRVMVLNVVLIICIVLTELSCSS